MLFQNQWVENGNTTVPGQPIFIDVAEAAGVTGRVPVPFGPDYEAEMDARAFFQAILDGELTHIMKLAGTTSIDRITRDHVELRGQG